MYVMADDSVIIEEDTTAQSPEMTEDSAMTEETSPKTTEVAEDSVMKEDTSTKSLELTEDTSNKSTEVAANTSTQTLELTEDASTPSLELTEDTSTKSVKTKGKREVKGNKKGKRKAEAKVETIPLKKTKLINDGHCLFVGSLNHHNTYEKVKDSLAEYLVAQNLLVQDIRLDRSRKHAFVDLASEMDLTKALTLNGEVLLDQPIRVAKAKVKTVEEVVEEKVKAEPKENENVSVSKKTLFVLGLSDKTSTVTLQLAFEGAITAKISGRRTTSNKRYGFVRFDDEELCKLSKEVMEDCEIDGSKVTVDFATGRVKTKDSEARPAVQTAERRGKGKKQGPKSGKVKEKVQQKS